jgi:hypothetical protein
MTIDEMKASQARHRSRLLIRCAEDHAKGIRLALDAIYTDDSVFMPGGPP